MLDDLVIWCCVDTPFGKFHERIGDQFGTKLSFLIEGRIYNTSAKNAKKLTCTAGLMIVRERM